MEGRCQMQSMYRTPFQNIYQFLFQRKERSTLQEPNSQRTCEVQISNSGSKTRIEAGDRTEAQCSRLMEVLG